MLVLGFKLIYPDKFTAQNPRKSERGIIFLVEVS